VSKATNEDYTQLMLAYAMGTITEAKFKELLDKMDNSAQGGDDTGLVICIKCAKAFTGYPTCPCCYTYINC
jgi:hypothetical protein